MEHVELLPDVISNREPTRDEAPHTALAAHGTGPDVTDPQRIVPQRVEMAKSAQPLCGSDDIRYACIGGRHLRHPR